MNWWKRLTAEKWFPIAVFIAVMCVAAAMFTGLAKREPITSKAVRGALLPAQKLVTHTAVNVANMYNRMFYYDELLEENENLRRELNDLKRELNDAQDAVQENEELRSMIGIMDRSSSFTYQAARVVGRRMDEWTCQLTIDGGTKEGLALYQPVINADGLLGYITQISAHSAVVSTVLDPHVQAGSTVLGTSQLGVSCGDLQLMSSGRLKLRYLTHDAGISVGSTVQTSGSGGVFPEGLLIGTIEQIETESDGMTDYAIVKPFTNVSKVNRVFIITDYTVNS